MFLSCQTQWRHAAMGQRTGLDYAGVEAVMRVHAVEDISGTFQRLQVLERATLNVDSCKACKKSRNSDSPCSDCVLRSFDHGA